MKTGSGLSVEVIMTEWGEKNVISLVDATFYSQQIKMATHDLLSDSVSVKISLQSVEDLPLFTLPIHL